MAESAISVDTTRFDYCPRMRVKAMHLPCGEREECEGCERSPDFLKYQQKQERKQEQDEKKRNHLGRLEEKTCEFCGKKFMGIKKRRFCSYACSAHSNHHTRSEKVCPVCGMVFMGTKQQIYCSEQCKDRGYTMRRQQDRGIKICPVCGKEFLQKGIKQFCSQKCHYKDLYQRKKVKKENQNLQKRLELAGVSI